MNKEISSNIDTPLAFNIQTLGSSATVTGNILATASFNGGLTLVLASATVTDGTHTPKFMEGSDATLSDASEVADVDLYRKGVSTGQEANAAFVAADDNKVKKLAYIGTKPYVRLDMVSSGVTTGAVFGAIAMRTPDVKDVGDPS